MAQINLAEEDIEFLESWYTPKAFSECMFHNWDNFASYKKGKFGELRLYQQSMLSDEPLIDFELTADYHGMDKKQEFNMRKTVSNIYCFGARKFGKTKIVQELELLNHMITSDDGNLIAFSSVDKIHLDKVLNPVKSALCNHKIIKKWKGKLVGSPDFLFELKNGIILNSINFTLNRDPGLQWFGSHVFRVYIEEACFSGRTRVACIDSNGKRETVRLSELVNKDKWKNLKALSYNFLTKKIEEKRIIKPFKKTVQDYTYYRVEVQSHDKNKKRVLEASVKQKFWTDKGYKQVTELRKDDIVYSLDYQQLSADRMIEPARILKTKPIKVNAWTMYDIEVEDNNNFFANGVLVHNSLETEAVYDKRKDALSELGAVFRCVKKDSLVLMSDLTTKRIQDIKTDDKIIGWDETKSAVVESTVLNSQYTGKKDVIKLLTESNELWLTPEHRVMVNSNGDGVWRWIKSIFLYQNKYNVKQFPFIRNLLEYYKGIFLGLVDSDGSRYVHKYKTCESVEYRLFQANEVGFFKYILQELNLEYTEDIGSTNRPGIWSRKDKPLHSFRIRRRHSDEIEQWQKTIYESNIDMQYGYLAGFIIGDGWIGSHGGLLLTQCEKNEHKVAKIKKICTLAGVKYNDRLNKEPAKRFFISFKKYAFPFLITTAKKTQTYRDRFLNTRRGIYPIKAVQMKGFLEKQEVYDLETTTGNFIANGFIVHNCAGMTDFTPHSPAGKAFYKLENQKQVLNYPQFVNPFFDEKENDDRKEEYGGKNSIGYKTFVKGEVVEDGVTALDMTRIRDNCYLMNSKGKFTKKISAVEITKENFKFWKNLIVVRRPENAERIWISTDVGLRVTEIIVHSEVNGVYEYIYNISLFNLTQQEIEVIFFAIITTLSANYIAIDCGEGEGRGIYSGLELKISKERLVYYNGSNKIKVGYEYDERIVEGKMVKEIKLDKNGDPVYKYELMSDWSVKRLKDILYEGKARIPEDLKFDRQFSGVIETVINGNIKYKCICTQGDHLFDAWKVFSIAEFIKSEFIGVEIEDPISDWGTGVCS